MDKDFIGKPRVARDLEAGTAQTLVGLKLDGKRATRAEDPVFLGEEQAGFVTSGSLAPSLEVAVAMAYVNAGVTEPGTKLEVEVRGKRLGCTVVELPFYREGTARKKG